MPYKDPEQRRLYHRVYLQKWRLENIDNPNYIAYTKKSNRKCWNKNRDKYNTYRRDNPEKRKLNESKRYQTDEQYRFKKILRARVNSAFRQHSTVKIKTTTELMGCSMEECRNHIESLWQPGMNWGNHGFGNDKWHLDHIIPCDAFDLSDIEQQKKCFHYTNLQPLWQHDNLTKSNKVTSTPQVDIQSLAPTKCCQVA